MSRLSRLGFQVSIEEGTGRTARGALFADAIERLMRFDAHVCACDIQAIHDEIKDEDEE